VHYVFEMPTFIAGAAFLDVLVCLLVFSSLKREEGGGHYQIQVHAEFRLIRLPLFQ
jgi:hypothetical protein